MAKGIIYVMSTVVPGLIKIGKTGTENFESRMYNLERNGYFNVVGLQRRFAIEVDEYDEKEKLLDEIFSKNRVPNSELFALDIELVVQLLASFEGRQVYPKNKTKENSFAIADRQRREREDWNKLPDGQYFISGSKKNFGKIKATMHVENGTFIVERGSVCVPFADGKVQPGFIGNARIEENILQEDVPCSSPSAAGALVLGRSTNGWTAWKDSSGRLIDVYRMPEPDEKEVAQKGH
ncbi:DUF4357 domain-containing protein [Jonquetella sp. BV3C21]|uniref:DUF4357 domain-containing protein n=2 Tax=Jonquetella TaxID=428711 RepID=UPI0003ADD5DB|nr:DUF4357 domain-containing protein [Jonquetella sp. BV3C21]ERL23495.1 T5orf172 domain protein [Jonquetella sp. BV3C21]